MSFKTAWYGTIKPSFTGTEEYSRRDVQNRFLEKLGRIFSGTITIDELITPAVQLLDNDRIAYENEGAGLETYWRPYLIKGQKNLDNFFSETQTTDDSCRNKLQSPRYYKSGVDFMT